MMQEDTIAAIATPMGEGGIGIIRISGSEALSIAGKIFVPAGKKRPWQTYRIYYGYIAEEERQDPIDEVIVLIMKAPHSYTREDVVEVHSHGGYVALKKILEFVLKEGARLAEPGEFTKRAFLNGRIDLSQAEAVADIIKAKTDRSLKMSLQQLKGHLSDKIKQIMEILAVTIATIEASIDFPEDDVEELTREEIEKNIIKAKDEIEELLRTADGGKILREGLDTVILGKPNVGKSSLLNALLRENRAIVNEIPGTTRDAIEEAVNIKGIPINIIDTAGIRETEDVIEKMGVERAVAYAEKADIVLLLLDDAEGISKQDEAILDLLKECKVVVLINKTDLAAKRIDDRDIEMGKEWFGPVRISVKEGSGMKKLEETIEEIVCEGIDHSDERPVVTNARHAQSLKEASNALTSSLNTIKQEFPVDMVSIDVREAWQLLGEIVGENTAEDMIEQIFSRFCLGK